MSQDKHGWYTPASDLEDKFYIPSPDYAEDIDDHLAYLNERDKHLTQTCFAISAVGVIAVVCILAIYIWLAG